MRILALAFILVFSAQTSARVWQETEKPHRADSKPRLDLTKIGLCASKGRMQDKEYAKPRVVDQVVAVGKNSVPALIDLLMDERKTKKPVFCYWYETTVGDIAFAALTDLFTSADWQSQTVPGTGRTDLLGPKNPDITGEQHLRDYIAKHGRKSLQEKWRVIWMKYKDEVYWDQIDRCFKLKMPPAK